MNICHGTLVSWKAPRVCHLATAATIIVVFFAEQCKICRIIGAAVNKILLRETNRSYINARVCSCFLDCHHCFQDAQCSESPAGTARTLIFNWSTKLWAPYGPVNICALELTKTFLYFFIELYLVFKHADWVWIRVNGTRETGETHKLHVLVIVEIGSKVDGKRSVTTRTIKRCYFPHSTFPFTFSISVMWGAIVWLVVFCCEFHELLIIWGC